MDFYQLLVSLGYTGDKGPFESSFILRPEYFADSNRLELPVSNKRPLPFAVYADATRIMEQALGMKVEIVIRPEIPHISANELRLYISHYEELNPSKVIPGIYPQETETQNLIVIPDAEEEEDVPEIKGYLSYLEKTGIFASCKFIQKAPVSRYDAEEASASAYKPKPVRIPDGAKNVHLKDIDSDVKDITVEGIIYSLEQRTSKKGKWIVSAAIHEGVDALPVLLFEGKRFPREFLSELKVGQRIKVYGSVQLSAFSGALEMLADAVEKLEPLPKREDKAARKRIELHAHTNKSEMDGLEEVSDIIKTAFRFGMPAIGITDHNVVQGYPGAQATLFDIEKANKGTDFKVLFGVEMHVVDDRAKIVTNSDGSVLGDAEYCVFDLETSGLSNRYDEIIEFGGVRMKNGHEVSRFQTFIKPDLPVTAWTTEFTGISEEDLARAPKFREVWPKIEEFMRGTVLVAHNGYFDYGFLDAAMRKIGAGRLTLPMIDTLPLARAVLPGRSAYRLGNIARYYHISYSEDEAHRADYDAYVLSQVFEELLCEVDDWRKLTLDELDNVQTKEIYKKNHPYHLNLLAKDQDGIKQIYDLVTLAHTEYLTGSLSDDGSEKKTKVPPEARIVRSEIEKYRSHCLVGAGCAYSEVFEIACNRSQEELEECMKFYDYIEIQPPGNYSYLLDESGTFNYDRLITILENIIHTAEKLGIPVAATGDVHYIEPEDKILRDIYIYAKRIGGGRHPMYYARSKKKDCPDQHFRTTDEMLECFSFLDEKTREKVVIDNTYVIADQIEKLHPLFTDVHTPNIEGCEKILENIVYTNAKNMYGDPLPEIVQNRLDREFKSVVGNGYAVQYYIAHLMVKQSHENGYIVGSRGSVGSSFLATMAGITEVNPLPPHYVCPKCKRSRFFLNNEYADGFDMPDAKCPDCGAPLIKQGHNIPFETFLGFYGDKVPDIDLNFSGEYQNKAQLQIKEIFGADNVFAAGTIATVELKTAMGYVHSYEEERHLAPFNNAKLNYLAMRCVGVKRTTGQHPAGIVVCPKINKMHDFTPLQYPANNDESPWKTTHFAFKDLHDTILKLDVLGHVDPTAIKMLQDMSGIDPITIPLHDDETLSLFNSTEALHILDKSIPYKEVNGALGIPEFGTKTSRNVLNETKPNSFAELVTLEGLTHGTDVWANNAQELIRDGICTISTVIGCRDDIMTYLISKGMDKKESFDIMEKVRKGKGLTAQWEEDMRAHDVPEWYIGSCNKIKYMFPKAHAVAYCMMALRIAWFKVHHPEYFYAVYFSIRADNYEIDTMIAGEDAILNRLNELESRKNAKGRDALSAKENNIYAVLEVAYEMYRRGYRFENISLEKSDSYRFTVNPDNHHSIIPPFTSIDGLGMSVANSIVAASKQNPFISREDLMQRTQLSGTHIDVLDRMGVLKGLQDTNQMSLF